MYTTFCFVFVYFDNINPPLSPTPPKFPLFLFPSQLHTSFPSPLVQISAVFMSWVWEHSLEHGQHNRESLPEKHWAWMPPSTAHALQVGWGFLSPSCSPVRFLTGLLLSTSILCWQPQPLRAHGCHGPAVSRGHFHNSLPQALVLTVLLPLLQCFLSAVGRGCDT